MTPTRANHDSTPPREASDRQLALVVQSHERLTGRRLVVPGHDLRQALWTAPCVIVAHGTEPDPIFFYGNLQALALFEMDAAAFVRMPSRLSAEPLLREERARLLERVTRDGCITDYAGVRISSTGKRFRIEQATVWNLIDGSGQCHGQAAAFDHWMPLPPPGSHPQPESPPALRG
ncbi:MAG: MEKHLA domain-containing protein [Burkholderiaceae bacterium]|nr:MEKHLA domain-containing protein [Burkholderiaceae bacterium]